MGCVLDGCLMDVGRMLHKYWTDVEGTFDERRAGALRSDGAGSLLCLFQHSSDVRLSVASAYPSVPWDTPDRWSWSTVALRLTIRERSVCQVSTRAEAGSGTSQNAPEHAAAPHRRHVTSVHFTPSTSVREAGAARTSSNSGLDGALLGSCQHPVCTRLPGFPEM